MDFNVELTDGACAVIRARGRLNLVSAPALRDLVARVVRDEGRSQVVVDLAETDFMDSSGLGSLVAGLKTARAAGGDLRIARPQTQVLMVLKLTNLDQILHPHETVEECIAMTGGGSRIQMHELHVCVDPDCLRKVHSLLAAMWTTSTDVSELDRMMFETAVMEIAANIVQHAPDKDPTKCNLILEVYPERLDALFKDDGRMAVVNVNAAEMPHALAESGRGLAIAKAAVDVLKYERHNGDNIWKLSRTRTSG
jgi:anti-anti-sigma factor